MRQDEQKQDENTQAVGTSVERFIVASPCFESECPECNYDNLHSNTGTVKCRMCNAEYFTK